ncbi:MAG: DUF998 domain-containing protein [Candidatus Limnocylindrales bacterium]
MAAGSGTQRARQARSLAVAALVGIALYLVADAVLAILRPDVSLLHDAESDYGRGPFAWLMDLNFLLRGALSIAAIGAIDLAADQPARLRIGLGLLAVWALASALLAFVPDSRAGGPLTSSGRIHLLLAVIAFLAATLGILVLAARLRLEATWRPAGMILVVVAIGATIAGLVMGRAMTRVGADGGLDERVFLGLVLLWLAVAAGQVVRTIPARAGQPA